MSEQLNLYEKLARIRKITEVINKNKKGFNYKYASIDEILAKVTAGMSKYKVSLIPQITSGSESVTPYHYENTKFAKDGRQYTEQVNEIITQASIVYTWVNDENPEEKMDIPWFIVASQKDPAQALGSGLTYGLRQFLLQFFQIATLDDTDPDEYRRRQREAEEEEDRLIAEKLVEEIHQMVVEYLGSHPDEKQKVAAITKKYVKENGKASNNYFAIRDPSVATELMNALKAEFSK